MKLFVIVAFCLVSTIPLRATAQGEPSDAGVSAYRNGDYAQAMRLLRPLASKGNGEAAYWVGLMYRKGEGVAQDAAQAAKWYLVAADKGDAYAQHELAYLYDQGLGVQQNDAEAVKWYRKAAENGYAASQYNLALMYQNGRSVPKDEGVATMWFRKAADQGDSDAQYKMGFAYREGRGVPKDPEESMKWFRKSADQGDSASQYFVAETYYEKAQALKDSQGSYFKQEEITRNYAEAAKWYRKAADQGDKDAQHSLGYLYQYGNGVEKNYAEAEKWYRKAADQGYALSQTYLNDMKKGVESDFADAKASYDAEDYKNAALALTALAQAGHAKSQYLLSKCYARGQGVRKDEKLADRWRLQAAENGETSAQLSLAWDYDHANSVEAAKWYKLAADAGEAVAQVEMGDRYSLGRGVPKDYAMAFRYYKLAAEQGDRYGSFHMGLNYELGRGVTANRTEAIAWYKKSIATGFLIPEKYLEALQSGASLAGEYLAKLEEDERRRVADSNKPTAIVANSYASRQQLMDCVSQTRTTLPITARACAKRVGGEFWYAYLESDLAAGSMDIQPAIEDARVKNNQAWVTRLSLALDRANKTAEQNWKKAAASYMADQQKKQEEAGIFGQINAGLKQLRESTEASNSYCLGNPASCARMQEATRDLLHPPPPGSPVEEDFRQLNNYVNSYKGL